MNLTEQKAWSVVNQPLARHPYEHVDSYTKRLRQQQIFTSRIFRKPSGCWLWTGSTIVNPSGVITPVFHYRALGKNLKPATKSEAAFTWIVRHWFPDQYVKRFPTVTSCKNDLCISPVHRSYAPKNSTQFYQKMTPSDVLVVYSLRYAVDAKVLAAKYKVSRNSIYKIWAGDNWSSVTGAKKKCKSEVGTAAGGAESPTAGDS